MLFSSNPDILNDAIHVQIDDAEISCLPSAKYLGVHLDSKLKWDTHISNLCKTLSPKVALLRKLKKFLPVKQLDILYIAIVQPHIDYCLTVWGYSCRKYVDKIQKLQNRAARIITGIYDTRESRGIELVKQLKWQSVTERRDYFTALLVHKALYGNAPPHITDLFTVTRDMNPRPTRLATTNNLYVPRSNKSVFKQSLQYNGSVLWNNLPENLRAISEFDIFKTFARKHFS